MSKQGLNPIRDKPRMYKEGERRDETNINAGKLQWRGTGVEA